MRRKSIEFDIVVLGAGPGGLSSALAAARNGAKVLLVERNSFLGGNMTIGLPLLGFLDKDGNKMIAGIADEFVDAMKSYKTSYGYASTDHIACPMHNSITLYDHEIFKFVAFHKIIDAGIEVLLNTQISGISMDNGRIAEIELLGKGWLIDVRAKIFIDATGDGDLAYLAGASFKKGQDDTGTLQPPTLMFTVANVDTDKTIDFIADDPDQMKLSDTTEVGEGFNADFFRKNPTHVLVGMRKLFNKLRDEGKLPIARDTIIYIKSLLPGQVHLNCTRHLDTDGSDAFSLSKALIEGHMQIEKFVQTLQEHVPGFENCYITNIAPSMGVRETRRFEGVDTLKEEDLVSGRINETAIGLGSYIIDIHMGDGLSTIVKKIPAYGLPYGITVSSQIDNLMFSGRCASMDAVAMSSARVMPTLMVMGEGAGVGAALAVKNNISPAQVKIEEIRNILKNSGVILDL